MGYVQGGETIATYVFFIMENIGIYCQMDVGQFEDLLYTILSEEPFKNQRFHMMEKTDYYNISDYVYQHFVMIIGETTACLTCHQNNPPNY